ncbi:hypothetical protein BDP27DRAFT_1390442 [Rhodocollybia butyracea]|uniref:alcohol dehydrogenase n=1 Tax=Rhodocollybia butyracea TaxID=206335 RepID=A0A9P5Q6P5_9AGAR|nr:hypothetical protein BDP27DRAFT_1390442 [Rhodocollybia butyracea]
MSTVTIPETALAAVITTIKEDLQIQKVKVVQPSDLAPGECLVKVEYAGCCHSDVHVRDNDWGVGKVVAIGANTTGSPVKIGDRVGMKWCANACLKCEMCRTGFEPCCSVARRDSHGCGVDGTFAEYTRCWVDYVTLIPEGLDSASVTPILCAGITVYKGLKRSNAKPGQWIAITGAGGGLGHLAVQYAVAMGLRVIAIDTGAPKQELCKKLGAEKWVDFLESKDLVREVQVAADGLGPHAALIAVGQEQVLSQAVMYLRDAGTLVTVGMPGATNGNLNVPVSIIITKCITIVGSATGNRQDMLEALNFVAQGKVACHYEVRDLKEVNDVMKEMTSGNIKGRIVLRIPS